MTKTGVDLSMYRLSVGVWALVALGGCHRRQRRKSSCTSTGRSSVFLVVLLVFLLLRAVALLRHGDVERNPGPSPSQDSVAGANLNFNSTRTDSNIRPLGPRRHADAASHHQRRSSNFDLLHFNARSLFPKRSEVRLLCSTTSPAVVAVTETWLDGQVPDGSFLPPHYTAACRTDRVGRVGGGVLLMCREDVHFAQRRDLCCWTECAWIQVEQFGSRRPLLIGCYYRPPKFSTEDIDEFISALESTFSKINLGTTDVALLGDFNATSSAWCALDNTNMAGRLLEQAFLSLDLKQCVSTRTHMDRNGCLVSLLDLVLVSNARLVDSVETLPPLGTCDHLPVLCKLKSSMRRVPSVPRNIWCYEKANFEKLNSVLFNADWSPILDAPDVNSSWAAWLDIYLSAVRKHVPSKIIKSPQPKLPWITASLEKEIKLKRSLFRQYKRSKADADRQLFNHQRNRVTKLLRKAERAYVLSLYRDSRSSASPTGSTSFWDFMRSLSGRTHRPPIPDLQHLDPHKGLLSSPQEKAEALNSFFVQQSDLHGRDSAPDVSDLPINPEKFDTICTTPSEVYNILASLPKRKAPGMDGVTTRLLRETARTIAPSLAVLFNRSFSECSFPSQWKEALVVPVFKRGERSALTNYRPIALLSSVGKVCERVVFNKLYAFICPFLSDHQSGFRKRDGTGLQLVRLVQQWSEALDKSQYIGAVFFDLRKAFDRVWHKGLIAKLEVAGVHGPALSWFSSYLSERRQQTRVANAVSSASTLAAGVPQGAILSPLLFIIYVNDAPQATPGSVNLFADDTSSFVVDSCPNRLSSRLQSCIDSLSKWFDRWLLSVNIQKSAVIAFRSVRQRPVSLGVSLNGQPVPQVTTHKHLGVIFNDTLTWDDHIHAVCSKASQRIGLLRRYSKRLPSLSIRHFYCTAIRPAMEYAAIAWCGLSASAEALLEKVQRRAARLICNIKLFSDTPHNILLARAGLQTLECRRRIEQAVFAFRFLHGGSLPQHLTLGLSHWLTAKPSAAKTLRNANDFRLPRPHKKVLKLSPLYKCLSLWNGLSSDAKSSKSPSGLRSVLSRSF